MTCHTLGRLKLTTHAGIKAAWGPVCARESTAIDRNTEDKRPILEFVILADRQYRLMCQKLSYSRANKMYWRLSVFDANAKDTVEGGSPSCSTRACTRNLGKLTLTIR